MNPAGWDFIADIHGHASRLEALLKTLGYERGSDGVFRHPERKAFFLGDYLNRGPQIWEAIQIVRGMCEAGSARALMGNHDFNALAWELRRAESSSPPNGMIRTWEQIVVPYPERWKECCEWIRTLPLWIEEEGFRAVHACWDMRALEALGRRSHVWEELLRGQENERTLHGAWILLNGPVFSVERDDILPDVNEEQPFEEVRARWWLEPEGRTLPEAAMPLRTEDFSLKAVPLSERYYERFAPYGIEEKPVFFGHYGHPAHPLPYASNVACLDLGVARGGPLCAYRWSGEQRLMTENFVKV